MNPIVGPYRLRDPYTEEVVADVWTVGAKWVRDGRQLGAYVMFSDKPNEDEVEMAMSLLVARHGTEGLA